MRRFGLIIIICLISFQSSTAQKDDNSFKNDIQLIINSTAPIFENQIEKEIVYKQLYGFFYYVKEYEGEKKWAKFINDFQTTNSITASLLNIYETTPYQLAALITYKLGKKLPNENVSPLIEKGINEFELILQDNSNAHTDIDYIEYLLKTYYSQLSETFFINDSIKEIYHQNLANLKDRDIKIYLLTNKEQISKQFGDVTGIAATLVGHEYIDSVLKINTRLLFKYNELFTMSALVHELTHIFWAFCYIDPEYTKPLPLVIPEKRKKELEIAFKPFSAETPLKEGIAEYMNAKFNLLAKYGFLENVDSQLHDYFIKTGEGFDLSELSLRIYNIKDNAPTYEIAHSLFNYICANYGFDKALKLTYSAQEEKDYYDILGTDLKTINTEWNKYIETYGQK
jgi:hypothetical protein